jgi:hypothetical protein
VFSLFWVGEYQLFASEKSYDANVVVVVVVVIGGGGGFFWLISFEISRFFVPRDGKDMIVA